MADEEWWEEFPTNTGPALRVRCWERKCLSAVGPQRFRNIDDSDERPSAGSIIDALGLTNARYIAGTLYSPTPNFSWNPFNYNSFNQFRAYPLTGEHQEINVDDHLDSGLEFYIYLEMDNLYVNYEMIRENDEFTLEIPGCDEVVAAPLPLTIRDDVPPSRKKHQVIYPWHNHGENLYGYWFAHLALPVFLRLESTEVQKLKAIFDSVDADGNPMVDAEGNPINQMNTLKFDLKYTYPKERISEFSEGNKTFIVVREGNDLEADEKEVTRRFPGLLTFGRERRFVRFMVASDIHVADRCDTIQSKASDWGIKLPPHGEFCNYNAQAGRLAVAAFDGWRTGKFDYVFLVGDLVDHVLKDSAIEENFQIEIRPTADFIASPWPYGIGEKAYNVSNVIEGKNRPIWNALNGTYFFVDSVHEAFHPFPSYPDDSWSLPNLHEYIDRLKEVRKKLKQFENTNWDTFDRIFSIALGCVPTVLVPGNHDYFVFGSELHGMEKDKFDQFVEGVQDLASDEDVLIGWMSSRDRAGVIALLRQWGIVDPAPEWQDLGTFHSMGITYAQAENYDKTRRLQCYYRAFLGPFWDEAALNGLETFAKKTGNWTGSGTCTIKNLPSKGGNIRFVWLDNGPQWNSIVNPSPWVRGFPDVEKEENTSITQLRSWRTYPNDMLIVFMHAPPVSQRYSQFLGTPKDICFKMKSGTPLLIGPTDKHPNTEFEFSNIWNVHAIQNSSWSIPNDPAWGAPFHGHEKLLRVLSPEDLEKITFEKCLVTRKQPVLTFSGHTHWRHTYSIQKTFTTTNPEPPFHERGSIDFLTDNFPHLMSGENGLLYDSNGQPTSEGAKVNWWKGRSLVMTTGCIGPIPPGEFKIKTDGKLERLAHDEAGYTQPEEQQGYYIVKVDRELGIVTNIKWEPLYYANIPNDE
jgi:hypothetical protein